MGVYKQLNDTDIRLLLWRMDETETSLKELLPDAVVIPAFKSSIRQIEWCAVHLALQHLCGRFFNVEHEASGKPYIKGFRYKLSVSHTKGYAVVALSALDVGVDIEYRASRALKIVSRFANEEEMRWINQNPDEAETKAVLLWSAKETLFKTMGETEVDFKEHLHIQSVDPIHCCMSATETKTDLRNSFEIHYLVEDDFVLTYTVKL